MNENERQDFVEKMLQDANAIRQYAVDHGMSYGSCKSVMVHGPLTEKHGLDKAEKERLLNLLREQEFERQYPTRIEVDVDGVSKVAMPVKWNIIKKVWRAEGKK